MIFILRIRQENGILKRISGGDVVAVSYKKLWKILIDKNMNRVELMKAAGIGTTTLSKLGKDKFVSMEVLVKICDVLDCNIGDIVDYVRKPNENDK